MEDQSAEVLVGSQDDCIVATRDIEHVIVGFARRSLGRVPHAVTELAQALNDGLVDVLVRRPVQAGVPPLG